MKKDKPDNRNGDDKGKGNIHNNNEKYKSRADRHKSDRHPILIITTICMVIIAVSGGLFSYVQLGRYERGIMDVCATQQDSYVQLVLDQINLKDNRNDEEIINDILKTMDSSSNKYWAFSKNQSMLFVKDVLETNRYKDVSADTYYNSKAALNFMTGLKFNQVAHDIIRVDDRTYLVSGVLFEYAGQDYRLCLMTEKNVLLDNNTYLEMKVQMQTFVIVLLLILVLVTTIYAFVIRRQAVKLDDKEADIKELCVRVSKLDERLMDKDLHDTKNNVWKQAAIVPFIEKLTKKEYIPITFAQIECIDIECRRRFLERAVYVLDRRVLRFEYGACDVVLIAVGMTKPQLNYGLDILKDAGITIQSIKLVDNNTEMNRLKEIYQ